MNLLLTPEMEQRIERQLARGFGSPEEVVMTALATLEYEEGLAIDKDELEAKLMESIEAADRGDTVPAKEVRAQLAAFRASL